MSDKSDLPVFSPSKLILWKHCPFAYYIRYELKREPKIPIYSALGRTIHYVLKLFYEMNFKDANSFVNYWKFYFRGYLSGKFLNKNSREIKKKVVNVRFANGDEGEIVVASDFSLYEFDDETIKKVFWSTLHAGENMLTQFYNKHKSDKKPFMVETQLRTNFKGYNLLGVVDKIIENEVGKKIIVDYKTTKQEPLEIVLNKGWQFTFYSLLFRENFGEKEEGLVIEHLRSGKEFKTTRGDEDYNNLERVLEEISNGIVKGVFTPNFDYHCRSCRYKKICEELNHVNIKDRIK